MSDLTIAYIIGAILVGILVGRAIDLFGATGLLHVRRELEIEVELNVKLLKENEILTDRNDALVEHHVSHHPELSPSRADSFPAQESTSAIPDNSSRAGGNSLGNNA